MRRSFLSIMALLVALLLGACSSLPGKEPIQVGVAGIENLPGEGLEFRALVKLRVQNPNDSPVEFNGVFVKLDVLGKTLASGVSDEKGSIPRFGESVIEVPVSASALRIGSHALGVMLNQGKELEKVDYKLTGSLGGPAFGSVKFTADGEFKIPKGEISKSEASKSGASKK